MTNPNPVRARIAKTLRDARCYATVLLEHDYRISIYARNHVARTLAAWTLRHSHDIEWPAVKEDQSEISNV